jgi:hypothetical protein
MKKLSFLLAVVFVLTFTACSSPKENSDLYGKYVATSVLFDGDEAGANGEYLELSSGGKAVLYLYDKPDDGTWTSSGDTLKLNIMGTTLTGTIKDNSITMKINDDATCVFTKGASGSSSAASESSEGSSASSAEVSSSSPNGKYECTGSEYNGTKMSAAGEWIEFGSDNRGTVYITNEYPFTWSISGNEITITEDAGPVYTATIDNGVISLNTGMMYYFAKGGSASSSDSSPDTEESSEDVSGSSYDAESYNSTYDTYWGGGWYGFWYVESAYGSYIDWDNGQGRWDCCADISVIGEEGVINIWDTDGSSDSLMVSSTISFGSGITSYGAFKSEDGQFWDCSIGHADWIVDPGSSGYENLIIINGRYVDPENSENYFDYVIYLRPWGQLWDDIQANEPDNIPSNYNSWYIPLMNSGSAMPDTMS